MKTEATYPPIPVNPDVAQAVADLKRLLNRDFGSDYSFQIVGNGHFVARSNIEGVIEARVKL